MKPLTLTFSLTFIAIVLVTSLSNAQSKQNRIGVKAGLTVTTLSKSNSVNQSVEYSNRTGFQGGLYADLPLSHKLTFMPQVLFSQKGGDNGKYRIGMTSDYTVKQRLNYIDVPLLIGFRPTQRFTLLAGPQTSFLLSQSYFYSYPGFSGATSTDKKYHNKMRFGGNVGLNFGITKNVDLQANYLLDFGSSRPEPFEKGGETNSGFAFTLGYKFY